MVNSNMFDAKTRYRKWTGGGHKIHSTNDTNETKQDLFLLINQEYEKYLNDALKTPLTNPSEVNADMNIAGCMQWSSLSEFK